VNRSNIKLKDKVDTPATEITWNFSVGKSGRNFVLDCSWADDVDLSSGHMYTKRSLLQVGKKGACDQSLKDSVKVAGALVGIVAGL
jgi:hypothetical protein